MIKRLMSRVPGRQPSVVAEFRLQGGKVSAEWSSPSLQADVEVQGISDGQGDLVTPREGPRFWAALDRAFNASSHLFVEAT